jgi:hypothetical protein
MQKSIRSIAVFAALAMTAVPALHANRMGTNPHPQVAVVPPPSILDVITYTALSYFGL